MKCEITPCTETNEQNIIINNPNNNDITSIYDYIISKSNKQCFHCEEGNYINYDFMNKIQKCSKCPNNTYSKGGNFIIDGDYEEWTDNILSKFQSNKYFLDSIIYRKENYCSPFSIYNNKILVSGDALNSVFISKLQYVVQLNINIQLVAEGNITFYYQKGTIYEKDGRSGIFRFFINYIEMYKDDGLINIDEINYKDNFDIIKWKKYNKALSPGFYSFLFQYTKYISSQLGNFLTLKIK